MADLAGKQDTIAEGGLPQSKVTGLPDDLASKQPLLSTLPGTGVDLLHTQSQLRRIIGADGIEASIIIDLNDPAQSFRLKVSGNKLRS